jgi:methionyl-tRNA formyltransferase
VIPEPPWRVVIFSMILPAALGLDALTRAAGHETVALLTPRLRSEAPDDVRDRWHDLVAGAPDHLDVCLVPEKSRLPRLLRAYKPDLAVCLGYPWLLPPEVLAIPTLGVLNGHPSPLPRWRGPFPVAWAIREGDSELGLTYHLMDETFDTGPILAQGAAAMPKLYEWEALQPVVAGLAQELMPKALERLARGERGDEQAGDGPYAGRFPAEFVELDLTLPASVVHRHVASWRFVFVHDG